MCRAAYTTQLLVDCSRSNRCIAEVLTIHDSAPLAFAVLAFDIVVVVLSLGMSVVHNREEGRWRLLE